jgi:hypothetical protein
LTTVYYSEVTTTPFFEILHRLFEVLVVLVDAFFDTLFDAFFVSASPCGDAFQLDRHQYQEPVF